MKSDFFSGQTRSKSDFISLSAREMKSDFLSDQENVGRTSQK